MRKRRSNLNLVLRGGLVALACVLSALPGCKKKEPTPPAPVHVQPLPHKVVQANMSASKQKQAQPASTPAPAAVAKPVQGKPAGTAQTVSPAGSATTVPPGKLPAKQGGAEAKPVVGKPEVQKQISSARMPVSPAGLSLDFTNRRDPFRPFIEAPPTQKAGTSKVSALKDALPIQAYETESFRISGIITGIKENSALVIDPKGKGYVVREGMLIGSNEGRIKRITNSAVEVEEKFRDDNGRVKKRLVKLALTRKK